MVLPSVDEIQAKYPLHWLVWNNEHQELQEQLNATEQHNIELLDSRGRTPLMLAVCLCHLQSVKVLLAARCNANAERNGWSVVQEAVCTGDAEILTAILEVRDLQRHVQRVTHVPQLLQKLVDAPDFYIEMKWEFTSWVPLMSRMCPSDTYKVYKRGANVRIDTTLLGFDHTNWQRGDRSYIFKGQTDSATMIEIDHEAREVSVEQMHGVIGDIIGIPPNRESVKARLNAPVSTNHVDMDKISFERNKSGIWGWRSDKSEEVSGYQCKVYAASNVEFVSSTRSEHLTEAQANRFKNSRNPLQSFLGLSDDEALAGAAAAVDDSPSTVTSTRRPSAADRTTTHTPTLLSPSSAADFTNFGPASSSSSLETPLLLTPDSCAAGAAAAPISDISAREYFSTDELNGRDIGRQPTRISSKVQRFKANLWLSEEYPIQLQEQVLPILDLMSTMASPHVSKLKDFITMQLPAGFPVKIEIPLFHVLNACVTFGNIFGLDQPVPNVSYIRETPAVPTAADDDGATPTTSMPATLAMAADLQAGERLTCIIEDSCFDVPPHYTNKGADHRRHLTFEDEDDLLQFAIQQSLLETGSESEQVDIWEALKATRPLTPSNLGGDGAGGSGSSGGGGGGVAGASGLLFGSASASEEEQLQRVLQESLYGYHHQQLTTMRPTTIGCDTTTPEAASCSNNLIDLGDDDDGGSFAAQSSNSAAASALVSTSPDADLALALRISEQEQLERQLELDREQQMLDEALRLSLQDN